jgi:tripartite-type tricarboxylate transporter receptor subunit TctC
MTGRSRFAVPILLVASLVSTVTFAQQYPSKMVRVTTYATPGGGFDRLLRVMADELSRIWNQPVLVDNRPGAVGMIQAEACAKSPPDGYTVCLFDRAQMSMMPHLYKKLPYDPAKDFQPVTNVAYLVSVLATNAAVPADSMREFLALAEAKRGALNFGSLGVGTHPHMVVAWINKQHGTDIVHVPYKSAGALVQALTAGEIQMTYFGLFNLLGPIRGGKLRALAVSSASRHPLVPNVPTFAEAGLEGLDGKNWIGLFVPAGTPTEIVSKIQQDVARVFAPPEFRERAMVSQGWEPILDTPEAAARAIHADRAAAAALVRISGAQLD